MKKNQGGYSIVELIVVIGIMAVLVGTTAFSVGMISTKKAQQCRDELVSKLSYVRTTTMGKNSVVSHIYQNADGQYVMSLTTTVNGASTTNDYKLDSKGCTMRYSTSAADVYSDAKPLVDDTGIYIEFDRSSGAIKLDPTTSTCVQYIWVTKGSKTYGIKFYQETGKMEDLN